MIEVLDTLSGYLLAADRQIGLPSMPDEFTDFQRGIVGALVKGALFEGFQAGRANPSLELSIESIVAETREAAR